MIVTGLDTETTSLIDNSLKPLEKQPQIIEFYSLSFERTGDEMEEISSHHFLAHPGKRLSEETTRITNITDAMLEGAERFAAHAAGLVEVIEASDEVVAHNLAYDKAVIDFELQRIGMTVKWPKRLICTVEATEFMKGFRLSLSALHEELFGEKFEGAHRAEVDVRAMMRCYAELARRGDV